MPVPFVVVVVVVVPITLGGFDFIPDFVINVFPDQSQKVVFILPPFDLDFNLSSAIHSSFTLFHNPGAQCLPKMLVRALAVSEDR